MAQDVLLILSLFSFFYTDTQGQTETVDSIRYNQGVIYYHSYGQGKPVLVLSGGPGIDYRRGEKIARMASKNVQTILLEQRGTGRSMPKVLDSTTINLATAHDDINRLLNRLHLQKITIVAHSWGGMLAMSYACAFPTKIESLVLVAPGPFKVTPSQLQTVRDNRNSRLSSSELAELIRLRAKKSRSENEENQLQRLDALTNIYDKSQISSLFEEINSAKINARTNALMGADLFKTKFDLSTCLSSIKSPIHLICGNQDPLAFVSYELKLLLPKAKLSWIPQCGHFPMYEQPSSFSDILLNALN